MGGQRVVALEHVISTVDGGGFDRLGAGLMAALIAGDTPLAAVTEILGVAAVSGEATVLAGPHGSLKLLGSSGELDDVGTEFSAVFWSIVTNRPRGLLSASYE
jgi:hypothetical protein